MQSVWQLNKGMGDYVTGGNNPSRDAWSDGYS